MKSWIHFSILAVSTSGWGCARVTAAANPEPTVIELRAGDYHFFAPDTIPSGLVSLRSLNTGTELHHVQLVRFDHGQTLADLAAQMDGDVFPPWAHQVGGVGAVAPGDSAAVTMLLVPGRYGLICFIPSPDGVPHFARGMMKALEVVPGEEVVVHPNSDLVMVLDDYRYELSGSLKRGTQTIEITNAASQPHEVVLVQLEPGIKALEFVEWFFSGARGQALGRWLGGTVGMARGERNWITLTLGPGTYTLLCFLPDYNDRRMHIEHGMVRELTVE